jgi:tRNA1Val (adenine37-N6)-methyltransferase
VLYENNQEAFTDSGKRHKIVIEPDEKNRELTKDTLFRGRLFCFQHKKGYRFSIDSVLLAHFMVVNKGDSILDLGAGCGILGLLLAYRYGTGIKSVTGVEIQASLARLAEKNFTANGFNDCCTVIRTDIKMLFDHCSRESFSKVICNPPFYRPGRGRVSGNEESLIARHQVLASVADFLAVSASAVKNRGSVVFVYPATESCELILEAEKYGLEAKRIRFVYSYPDDKKDAELVLIHFLKNGGVGVNIMSPLYIYEKMNGKYSREVESYYI